MPNKRIIEATQGFSDRLKRAKGMYLARTGEDMTQAELAEKVAKVVGRAYGQTAAGAWFRGVIPDTTTIAALGLVYGVRAAWLAFGEGPPDHEGPPVTRLG
jgi:hypothetical protein